VLRKGGCNGRITCKYKAESDTALSGLDFECPSGVLEFEAGQASATLQVMIKPRGRYETKQSFRVVLHETTGGAKMDASTDGGATSNILTVFITGDEEAKTRVDTIVNIMKVNWERQQIGHACWMDQFMNAIYVNGGDEEADPPGAFTYFMHFITVFWKVLFAFCPPSDYCGGWLCFCCSLIMIGGVTAFIADLAALLGCTMGIPDGVTAITFVALGTSLPDTFASKIAAEQDPYADASIGNVTGSNSVNVFLGIGLSWSAGAIYWSNVGWTQEWADRYPLQAKLYPEGGKFVVIGGNLDFSVMVFCCCATVCIIILLLRRHFLGGELGGPSDYRYATSGTLIFLWLAYIGLSTWKTFNSLDGMPCN